MLWSVIYLNRVWAKVCQIWVPSKYNGDRALETSEGQFIGNDGVWIWLVGDNINVNQNIGTWHQLEPPWTSDLSTFWNEKILFVYWKFNGMYCKCHSRRSELFRTNHFFATVWQGFRWDKAIQSSKCNLTLRQEIPQQSLRVSTFFYRKASFYYSFAIVWSVF